MISDTNSSQPSFLSMTQICDATANNRATMKTICASTSGLQRRRSTITAAARKAESRNENNTTTWKSSPVLITKHTSIISSNRSSKTDETTIGQDSDSKESNDDAPSCFHLSDVWKARFLILGAAALYGTNYSFVKLLGDTLPVGISLTLRFGLASLCTMPWLISKRILSDDNTRKATWLGFEVGIWTSIGYVLQAIGLQTTPASITAFVASLAVVIVPLLDRLVGKKLLPKQWIGAVLAVVGVAFLQLGDISSSSFTTGDIVTLIQPLAFGLGFWRMENAMQLYPKEASRMTSAQLFANFLASLIYGLCTIDLTTLESYPWVEWFTTFNVLFCLFWTGAITTALTVFMETLAMKTLSATETTLIYTTEPLWGAAFAAILLGEHLGYNVYIGAAFILIACIYSNLGTEGILNLFRKDSKDNSNSSKDNDDEDTAGTADLDESICSEV